MGAVNTSTATYRTTWKAVTAGTPSSSTLAVMHISAMPPGDVASSSVAGCRPVQAERAAAKPADSAIIASVPPATLSSQRGAARANSGVKRVPSDTPMNNCPALVAQRGWSVVNVDAVVVAERPKLKPHIAAMRAAIANRMGLDPDQVGVKATTNEQLGAEGREEGISCHAVALLQKP